MKLVITDFPNELKSENTVVFTWDGYQEGENFSSLFLYIDKNAEKFRLKYLEWVYQTNDIKLNNGLKLSEGLIIKEDLSYWWLTLISEKCPWKQTSIKNIIRLLAIEDIIKLYKISSIEIDTSDQLLFNTFKGSVGSKIPIVNLNLRVSKKEDYNKFKLIDRLPVYISTLIRIFYFLKSRLFLKSTNVSDTHENEVFFLSFLDNLNPKFVNNGVFNSYYWGDLSNLMLSKNISSYWGHFFIPGANLSGDASAANEVINEFNKSKFEGHTIIDSHITFKIVLKSFWEWIMLNKFYKSVNGVKSQFVTPLYNFSCWNFIEKEVIQSFFGWEAFSNVLWLNVFDKCFKNNDKSKAVFYLCENQPWEIIFNYTWRKYNKGDTIGVLHGTNRRFWEMSNFFDYRVFESKYPLPDYIVLNGDLSYNEFVNMGYPKQNVLKGEALRYNHYKKIIVNKINNDGNIRVLVLGDINPVNTNKMMKLLDDSVKYISSNVIFNVKSHPNYKINSGLYGNLKAIDVDLPIGEILQEYDLVFSTTQTSSSLDVYLCRVPIVIIYDDSDLNYSPLRNTENVLFLSTELEIAKLLNTNMPKPILDIPDLFYTDSNLMLWSSLLSNYISN